MVSIPVTELHLVWLLVTQEVHYMHGSVRKLEVLEMLVKSRLGSFRTSCDGDFLLAWEEASLLLPEDGHTASDLHV
jgi:hypothetical protein